MVMQRFERHWSCSVMGFSRCCHRATATRGHGVVNDDYHLCDGRREERERGGNAEVEEDGRLWRNLLFGLLLPFPPLFLPSGRPRNHGLLFSVLRKRWPSMARQTLLLFGKQVTILSGSIFLPLSLYLSHIQLQNFLDSNRFVEPCENETKF